MKTPRRRPLKPLRRGPVTIYRDIYKFERLASDLLFFPCFLSLFPFSRPFLKTKMLTASFSFPF